MAVRHGSEAETEARQHAFNSAAELLCMLQGAGAMEGQALLGAYLQLLQCLALQHFDQVLGQGADPRRLGRVRRVAGEQMAVVLDEGAAAAGGLHDGFGAGFDGRPPGVDVLPGALQARFLGVEVIVHGTAAAGLADWRDTDAQTIKHARGGGVGVGRQPRLHAAFEHQHAARVLLRRAWLGRANLARQFGLERGRQQRAQGQASLGQRLEQRRSWHHGAQALTQQAFVQWPRYRLLDHFAADIQQIVVLHAGRAGGFAVAAGQAAIQVLLGLGRDFVAFEHLLDQVDAPARAVQLVAEQLIGRAGGVAEAAMHAGAQDAFGFLGARQAFGLFTQIGLHVLYLGVHAARVENTLGVELVLQLALVAQQRCSQRLEGLRLAGDEAGGMAAELGRYALDQFAIGVGFQPALRAAPVDQLAAGQVEQTTVGWQRQTPQRAAGAEER